MTDGQQKTLSIPFTQVKDFYFLLGKIDSAISELRDSLKPLIIGAMGKEKEMTLEDGWTFVLEERLTRQYDPAQLRLVFDADQLAEVMKPDNKLVQKMTKQLGISAEKVNELERGVIVTGKSEALKLKSPSSEFMSLNRKQ